VPRDIILVSRAALYWDTFDTDPIGSRMTLVSEGPCIAWHQPSGHGRSGLVVMESIAGSGECALLVQGVTLPTDGSVFVAFTALIEWLGFEPFNQISLFGAILSRGDFILSHYYAGSFNKSVLSPFSDNIVVRYRITTATNSSRHVVNWNTWYNGTLALAYMQMFPIDPSQPVPTPSTMAFYADENYTIRSLDLDYDPLDPDTWERIPAPARYAGLSIYTYLVRDEEGILPMRAYFDSMLVTVDERPWIVRVEGLQPGWRVVLKDGSGNVIDSKTAAGDFVELNVWGVWIIKDGRIEIYDSSNNLLTSRSFPEILGGDVYRVTE
jgi:hypothetical protein